ncbi:MAG: ATPase [Gemmatimonadetes bacterium]|jgi:K+-sensing histidine kinase KdpD|nr:ATPase [Gemmatimonadota bacterium]
MRSPTHRAHLTRTASHNDHLAAVVGAIFSLSRRAERGVALQLSDVPVRELLDEVHAIVQPFAVAGDVSLLVDCEHAPTVVYGEHTALLWALMNLTCRVVKSTPSGGQVLLSAAVLLHSVELRVMHTESMTSHTLHPSLFAPIEHAHATDEVEIARDLTRLMGGELLFRSTAGTGALYAMRFHAAWRPARRLAHLSMAMAA